MIYYVLGLDSLQYRRLSPEAELQINGRVSFDFLLSTLNF